MIGLAIPFAAGALFAAGLLVGGMTQPQKAVTALGTGRPDVLVVVASMVAGMLAHRVWERRRAGAPPRPLHPG